MNYQTGQSVIYRNKGVYTIESIGKVAFLPDSEKIYYTLRPVFRSGDEHIYMPTDKEDALRHSLSAQEAGEYLKKLNQMKARPCHSTKTALIIAHYQELLSSSKIEHHLQLLKEIHEKELRLIRSGKRLGTTDKDFLSKVGRLLCEEFAAALQESPESARKQLAEALGTQNNSVQI